MSSSRQTQGPSSSPSKSSLRRTSSSRNPSSNNLGTAGPTTHFASEATQHHFLPHSPPNQNLEYEDDDDDEDEVAVQSAETYGTATVPQPPQLQPFFTLVEDTLNNEHYHPTVHYIFADDDTEIITEAACRSLEQEDGPNTEPTQRKADKETDEDLQDAEPPRLPKPIPGVKEHYLILDVQPQLQPRTSVSAVEPGTSSSPIPTNTDSNLQSHRWAYTVSSSSSLSPDWQVLRSTITDAPTMLDAGAHNVDDPENLMLRIEGRGGTPPDSHLQTKAEKENMEEMIEKFQKRLSEIRTLIEAGDLQQQEVQLLRRGQTSLGGDELLDEPD